MTFQTLTRGAVRRSVGLNLGIAILGEATSTVDTSSLIDTINLLGGNDEYNLRQVRIYDAAGSIVDGEDSVVSDFVGASNDATCAPVFSASITDGDKYEMWEHHWRIADIDDAINQTINEVSGKALAIKEIHTPFTESGKYLYAVLSGFTHLTQVEYVYSKGIDHLLSDCETAWTAGASVTATADTAFVKKGTYSAKFVVAAGAASGATLGYLDITEVDLSDAKEVELWFYSSIAITAGQLQFMLDNTAACASALETINIPAMSAGSWYRHVISLADPAADTAIISIGVRQASGVDVGAFTFYLDDVRAVDGLTHDYRTLAPEYWGVAQGSTPYLQLTSNGLSLVGSDTQLRLTGFAMPARLDADATNATVDPAYLIAKTTARLLVGHAKSRFLDIEDKLGRSQYWEGIAARLLPGLSPSFSGRVIAINP